VLNLGFAEPHDRPLRLLCIGAHCDDIEIGAGATVLQLLAARPVDVCWLVVASDEVRRAEAHASAVAFCAGAKSVSVVVGTFLESVLPSNTIAVRDFVLKHGRPFGPDLVLCPRRADLHQDHRLLGELALQLFRDHPILEYEIPKYDGDLVTPNVYVPFDEDVMARKSDLLMTNFPSQHGRPWFTPETFSALARVRGVESASRYAEGFTAHKLVLAP
jgi:LmbE family N-acetylglucosaminyl deacetylase